MLPQSNFAGGGVGWYDLNPVEVPVTGLSKYTEAVGAGVDIDRAGHGGPVLPAAGIGDGKVTQQDGTTIQINRGGATHRAGNPHTDDVAAGIGYKQVVVCQPFTRNYPAEIGSGVDVSGGLSIRRLLTDSAALLRWRRIVQGVVLLRLRGHSMRGERNARQKRATEDRFPPSEVDYAHCCSPLL